MQHLFSIDRVLYIHDLYEDGVCFTLSRRNLQVAGFFAGAAQCISLEKTDFTSLELVLPSRYTPHGWLAAWLPGAAAVGSSRACRGCRQAAAAAARTLPSASLLRRHTSGTRPGSAALLLPSPPAAPRALMEPRRDGLQRLQQDEPGCSRPGQSGGRHRALKGLVEQGLGNPLRVSPRFLPSPDPQARQWGRLRGADRRCPRAFRRSRAPRLGQLRCLHPLPTPLLLVVPSKPRSHEPGVGWPYFARPGRPLGESHGGDPRFPPHPIAKAPRKEHPRRESSGSSLQNIPEKSRDPRRGKAYLSDWHFFLS